jgi:hypothetical protein
MQGFTVPEMNAKIGEGLPVHVRFLTVCILHELQLLNKSGAAPGFMPGFAGLTGSASGFTENRVAISPNGRAARWLRHFYGRKLTPAAAEAAFCATFQPDILWERESSRQNIFETLGHDPACPDAPFVYSVSCGFISEFFGRYSDSQGVEKMLGWPDGFAEKFFGNSYRGIVPESSRKDLAAGDPCPHCGGTLAEDGSGVLACPECGVKFYCGVSFEEEGPRASDLSHSPESEPAQKCTCPPDVRLSLDGSAFAPKKTDAVRFLAACALIEMRMQQKPEGEALFSGFGEDETRAELFPDGFAARALEAFFGRRLTKALVLSAAQAALKAGPLSLKLFSGVTKPFDRREMEKYRNGLAFAADEVTPWILRPAAGGRALLDGTLTLPGSDAAKPLCEGRPQDALPRIAAGALGLSEEDAEAIFGEGRLPPWSEDGAKEALSLLSERSRFAPKPGARS